MEYLSSIILCLVGTNAGTNSSHIGCFVKGECAQWIDHHNLVDIIKDINTPESCLGCCKKSEECLYFTHFQISRECYLYPSCNYFFFECKSDDCISGESTCTSDVEKEDWEKTGNWFSLQQA